MSSPLLRTGAALLLALVPALSLAEEATVLRHTQLEYVGHRTRPVKGPPVVVAERSESGLTVSITDLEFYCAPAPLLAVSATEAVATVRVLPPTGAVARCRGAHDLRIQVADLPTAVTSLVLVDHRELERARVPISAPAAD